MDTSKYIKKCPQCGTDIEPKRIATMSNKIFAGITGVCGGFIGFFLGGPAGAAAGATLGYCANKKVAMAMDDDYNTEQWFKFKCPKCGNEWKERIHTNDHPDDPTPLMNAPY